MRFPEYDDYIYRPTAGSGIAFSCQTIHEARPVTKGERYIVVAFLHGDEDEAFRRYYCMTESTPVRAEGYIPTLRDYSDLQLSRGFYHEWRDKHVQIAWDGEELSSKGLTPAQIKQEQDKSAIDQTVKTVGNHRCKKVFESRAGVVFDDFLPEDVYQRLYDFSVKAEYEEPSDIRTISDGWKVHSGFPLRGKTHYDYYNEGAKDIAKKTWPSGSDLDVFVDHLLALVPEVEKVIGKINDVWDHVSVAPWMYPHGTSLAAEAGGKNLYSGSYLFGLNARWYMEWGGLVVLDDGEHGITKSIILRKNRIVFIASNAYRMITRLNEQSGDELRYAIAGNFYRKTPTL